MQLCIHITRITNRNIEVFGSPGLLSFCTVRHDPQQQVTLLRAMERNCSLPTHSTSVCSCAWWVESSDSRPQIALSCCHTQLVFLDYHTRLGCLDCRIHISDSTPRMCRLFLVSKLVSHTHRKVALYFPCIQHFCRAWQHVVYRCCSNA